MKRINRKIVLVNQTIDQRLINGRQLELNEKEVFTLDPIRLYGQIDWTKFEDNVEVINKVYGELFELTVLENKPLICYWPTLNFPDDLWFELVGYCKSAGFQVEVNYTKDKKLPNEEILPEFQQLWKSFTVFMLHSLCEDIQFNEGFEEIAYLKGSNESILLFKVEENGEEKFSYLLSVDSLFEFEPSSDAQKKLAVDSAPVFTSFNHLMEKLQEDVDLEKYNTTFINRTMEKIYFNSFIKKSNANNLIARWIENYYEN